MGKEKEEFCPVYFMSPVGSANLDQPLFFLFIIPDYLFRICISHCFRSSIQTHARTSKNICFLFYIYIRRHYRTLRIIKYITMLTIIKYTKRMQSDVINQSFYSISNNFFSFQNIFFAMFSPKNK